jgi:hypothetical protein
MRSSFQGLRVGPVRGAGPLEPQVLHGEGHAREGRVLAHVDHGGACRRRVQVREGVQLRLEGLGARERRLDHLLPRELARTQQRGEAGGVVLRVLAELSHGAASPIPRREPTAELVLRATPWRGRGAQAKGHPLYSAARARPESSWNPR